MEKSVKLCVQECFEAESEEAKNSKANATTPMSIKQLRSGKNDKNSISLRVQCIEAICAIITEQLPDLWRLGQSYFTGQLHVSVNAEKQGPFKV